MTIDKTIFSVAEAASLCSVSRGTINYWIQTKKLYASRTGRNYSIPENELIFFLKSTGKEIPSRLINKDHHRPIFRKIKSCWEYWHGKDHAAGCKDGVVLSNKLDVCFTGKESSRFQCNTTCSECQYYLETYFPRIQMVHQFSLPAIVYKDLYIWGGNREFSKLCGCHERQFPGMGIEQLVHPDSLAMVISNIKNRALRDQSVPRSYSIYLNHGKRGKMRTKIAVYSLKEPSRKHLVLFENEKN